MENIKITAISLKNINKEGQTLLDKNSRPYTRVGIKTATHGDKWLSGLAYQGDPQLAWKVGDEISVDIVPNGQYLNFNIPREKKANGGSSELMEKLFLKVNSIVDDLKLAHTKLDKIDKLVSELGTEPVTEEIKLEDIPF